MADWDKKYREGFYDGATEPHRLLQDFWQEISGNMVIDVAMGNGRNSVFLAKKGFLVCGLEKSAEAIHVAKGVAASEGREISIVRGDAAALPFKKGSADCVMVFYFLMRDTVGNIADILKKGGLLIYETFLKRQNEINRRRNPEYLLDDGELISYFRDFHLLFYEETITASNDKKKAVARFVGRKR